MNRIKVGDMVYSDFFGCDIKVVRIDSNTDWYFEFDGHILKAQSPLSYFEKSLTPREGKND